MPVNDDLGTRMKLFYEQIPKTRLMRRYPVLIRIDGKAFHTFTKGFKRPFDKILIRTMQETTKYLCENIQGCVLGYTQSDEITIVLVDYKKLTSSAWFDYEVQKMCSVAASMTTMVFNKIFEENIDSAYHEEFYRIGLGNFSNFKTKKEYNEKELDLQKRYDIYYSKLNKAMFDARCFNIPKEEVTNCLYWRQLDASRNSIQMAGQAKFSHKELQNKSCDEIQDMLMTYKGIDWNDLPTYQKRGSCVIKRAVENWDGDFIGNNLHFEGKWIIDKDIPVFKGDGREYIDRLVYVGGEESRKSSFHVKIVGG